MISIPVSGPVLGPDTSFSVGVGDCGSTGEVGMRVKVSLEEDIPSLEIASGGVVF